MRIERKESALLPTEYGEFKVHVYEDSSKQHHLALVNGSALNLIGC